MSATNTTRRQPTPENLQKATKLLRHTNTQVRDKREDSDEKLPTLLFERVARGVTEALKTETHPEKAVRFVIEDASPEIDDAEVSVEVELITQQTPNTLDYLANKYTQISHMGASVRDSRVELGSQSIPDGWMRVTYRFYTPGIEEAFRDKDIHQYPPLK